VLKEAFQHLIEVGRGTAATVLKVDAEPPHVYYLRDPDGNLRRVEAEPRPPMAAAYSLQAIISKALENEDTAEVWHCAGHVVTIFGKDKRGFVSLDLAYSDQYLKLCGWKQHKPALTQPELIRELRTTFRDSLAQAGELVEILRRVNFRATATTEGEVGHGKASLGKTIAGEVTGTKAIPEYVTFNFPIYANACFRSIRTSVECALDPDPASGTFRVIPLPGELEIALDAAVTAVGLQIREALGDTSIGVYYGKP